MHVMVVRRATLAEHPGLAMALVRAFARARDLVIGELAIEQAPKTMLPWVTGHLAQTRELMGERFWPYGVQPNRRTLEAQLRWAYEQDLIAAPMPLVTFFAEGMADLPEV